MRGEICIPCTVIADNRFARGCGLQHWYALRVILVSRTKPRALLGSTRPVARGLTRLRQQDLSRAPHAQGLRTHPVPVPHFPHHISHFFRWQRVVFTRQCTPISSPNWHNTQIGDEDGGTNGGSDVRYLDAETNVTSQVANDNDGFELSQLCKRSVCRNNNMQRVCGDQ